MVVTIGDGTMWWNVMCVYISMPDVMVLSLDTWAIILFCFWTNNSHFKCFYLPIIKLKMIR